MQSIIELKKQIDSEYENYMLNNQSNNLEQATLYFDDMLTDFYEEMSVYIAERYEIEKTSSQTFEDSINGFYFYNKPHRYKNHLFRNYLQKYKGENSLLDELVFEVRKRLCNNRHAKIGDEYSTEQYCGIASMDFQVALEEQNNYFGRIIATSTSFGIPNNAHAFNYVDMGEKQYIVDCTFSQFTKLYRMNVGIIKIPEETTNAEPAYFLMQTEEGKEILNKLLTCGYFELTPTSLKLYLDSFVLSNRNASYYLENDTPVFESGVSSTYYTDELRTLLESDTHDRRMLLNTKDSLAEDLGLKRLDKKSDFLTKKEIKILNKKMVR